MALEKFTKQQKVAILSYLSVSIAHSKIEEEAEELQDMSAVFAAINKLNKCFSKAEIDAIIINRNELAKIMGIAI